MLHIRIKGHWELSTGTKNAAGANTNFKYKEPKYTFYSITSYVLEIGFKNINKFVKKCV